MKEEIEIKIKAKFGSKFQKEFGMNNLRVMLQAWQSYLRYSHKQNNINVFVDGVNNEYQQQNGENNVAH